MTSVWVVWPTVHPELSDRMTDLWRKLGYKVAVLVNPPHTDKDVHADAVLWVPEWAGFPKAANALCCAVPADIVVVAGDDVHPEPTKTAQELATRFLSDFPDLCGVVQPTGDKYGCWNTCAVSPWIGRAYIDLMKGKPFHEGYFHYFSDEELQAEAEMEGAFRPWGDVTQFHDHWDRKGESRPPHLMKALHEWKGDRTTFRRRKAEGFPRE